jgi:hypothetical protein
VIQPVVKPDAVEAGKPAVVGEAHVAFLTADGGFALHEAVSLTGPQSAGANTLNDTLVLKGASLVDVCTAMIELVLVLGDCGTLLESRGLLRSSLSKAKSGGQCEKSDANEREFHGVSPGGGGVCLLLWPFRAHIHADTGCR